MPFGFNLRGCTSLGTPSLDELGDDSEVQEKSVCSCYIHNDCDLAIKLASQSFGRCVLVPEGWAINYIMHILC